MAKERNNFTMTEFILKVIYAKINKYQFENFLRNNGYKISGSKSFKLHNLELKLNGLKPNDFKKAWKEVESFFYDQIMYTTTRTVITFEYDYDKESILNLHDDSKGYQKLKEARRQDFQKSLKYNLNLKKDYQLIYQKTTENENNIEKIDYIFVRKVKYKEDQPKDLRAEFVWLEVDNEFHEVRIHLAQNKKTLFPNQSQGTPHEVYKYFSQYLQKELLITPLKTNEKETLFQIYKSLTSIAEQKYYEKVEEHLNMIEDFRNNMFEKLELIEADDSINSLGRLKLIFTRLLIQKDYDEFIEEQSKNEGRIKALVFVDPEGGSVQANSNSATTGSDPNELDLEKHTVYFDTRDSIYTDKRLFSITVFWNIDVENTDKGSKEDGVTKVKYTAYDPFYVTHFIRSHVNKEMVEYVLPKFRKFKETI